MAQEPEHTDKYVRGAVSNWEMTLIAALHNTHSVFKPGTEFLYSNIGYATLGAALARVAGEPYVEYVPKHIFAPLGMTHTSLVLSPNMVPHLSYGYALEWNNIDSVEPQKENVEGRGYKVPNGAIYTTVGDLAEFASFFMGDGPESVLKKSTLEDDLTRMPIKKNPLDGAGYGVGTSVIRRKTYTAFGHGGAVAGYQAALYMNRDALIGVILLANSQGPGSINTHDLALSSLDVLSK
jgi:CubicO group peptidase (beta-lactamase class C family)